MKNYCPVYCVLQSQPSQSLFSPVCQPFFPGADAQCSPIEGWPVVPWGTTQESMELSYRGTVKLPAENQRWKYAGKRQGGLIQCQHSIRLLEGMRSCLLACKLPPQEARRGWRRLHSKCHDEDWHIACCGGSRAHPDGDLAACGHSDLARRPLRYNQNK